MVKYHKGYDGTTEYVWYRGKDINGGEIWDRPHAACFASLFNKSVEKACGLIEVYHERDRIPYDDAGIKRWIDVINDLGFPCKLSIDKTTTFSITVQDYEHKLHLLSTLMLIRCLTETNLTNIPEQLFQMEDENPKIDRFKSLVDIHCKDSPSGKYRNSGHMVIYPRASGVDSFDVLMKNFKDSKMDVHHVGRGPHGYSAINDAWKGLYSIRAKKRSKVEVDEF